MSGKKGGGGPADTTGFYAELAKLEQKEDFDKALKVCNKILNADPKDTTAFHCKMVCLVQMGKFDDALRQMRDTHHVGVDTAFEEAYCLYKTNRPDDALEALEAAAGAQTIKYKELKAQILYRLERYEECFGVYREVLKNTSDAFDKERRTNLSAMATYIPGVDGDDAPESFEQAYNGACALLAAGDWSAAEAALRAAEALCVRELQDDGESEEDIAQEAAVIRAQIGFAAQMQGREKEAQSIYNQVLKSKPKDIALIAVASNNLMTTNKEGNIFDSKKRIKAATAEGLEHKLTSTQRRKIARNNALLAMYTNQVDLCRQLISDLDANFVVPADDDDRALVEAGVLSRSGRVAEAVDALLGPSGGGGADLVKTLIAAQIVLEKGDAARAVGLLTALPMESRCRPGILSAAVTLLLALDNRASAAKLLKEVVAWRRQQGASGRDMAVVWRKTAEFHLRGDDPRVAAHALQELLATSPGDRQTLAQLVLAYSKFDLGRALEASKQLPEFPRGSVDVNALESGSFLGAKFGKKTAKTARTGGAASPQSSPEAADAASPATTTDEPPKKKRKKKKRLPKNYNPKVDPDAERWLPRRERTAFRKPKRDRRNKGERFTGAQGGITAGQADTFDYSDKMKSSAVAGAGKQTSPDPSSAPTPTQTGPRQTQRKPQQKKKKKGNKF